MKSYLRKFFHLLPMLILVMCIASCRSYKDVAYFQNADEVENYHSSDSARIIRIMPKDVLNFTIAQTTNPEAASAYNLTVIQSVQAGGQMGYGSGSLIDYQVSNDGTINFPKIGKVYVVGKTLPEIERDIAHAIAPDFSEQPVITARLKNYKVTITGETTARGVVTVNVQRYISVLEALATQRDMTIYSKRNNVLVIREAENGEKSYYKLDFRDKNILNNPGYYLHQNDIVYVEPNQTRKEESFTGTSTSFALSCASIGITVLSFIARLF